MTTIDKYLKEISMPAYEPSGGDIMQCAICNRKVDILNEGRGPLICCGKPMIKVGEQQVSEAEGMKGLPKGWTQKSVQKFAKSLTGKSGSQKGFFDKCVEKMKGKISNPEGFCAAAKDEISGSTYWRGKGKTSQQAGKDIKAHQNVKRG
jgi:desulfoferrodoxin-like iron-binding protein